MSKVIILIALLLTGCTENIFDGDKPLTAKEISNGIDECKKFNLKAEMLVQPLSNNPHAIKQVICLPKQ